MRANATSPSLELSQTTVSRCAIDQRQVGMGLDLVVGGQAGARGDSVHADHDLVEVEPGQ